MERFEREGGLEYFSDSDVICLLLDFARCKGDRKQVADILLSEFGGFKGIFEARPEQLLKIKGIGQKTVDLIRLIVPFTRIFEKSVMEDPQRIGNCREASIFCKSLLMGLRNEQFYVICLNAQCKVIGKRKISDGSITEVNAYPRIVVETALNYNAHSVLLCHNHPGGTDHPSREDIDSTLRLQKALSQVGILVLDHILVFANDTYSMIQHGDIDYRAK